MGPGPGDALVELVGKPLKPEYLFYVAWEGNRTPVLVVVVYGPPDRLLTCSGYSHKILVGDWNVDMSEPSKPNSRYMRNILTELSLQLVGTGPTHHTDNTHTPESM